MEGDVPLYFRARYPTLPYIRRSINGPEMDERSRGWIYGSSVETARKKLTACRFPARAGATTGGNGNGGTFSRSAGPVAHLFRGRGSRPARVSDILQRVPRTSLPLLFLSVISIKRHMQLRVVANSITTSSACAGSAFFSLFN